MIDLLILLTVACLCGVNSTRIDGNHPPDEAFLRPLITQIIQNCGQIWLFQCTTEVAGIPAGRRCQCAPKLEASSPDQIVGIGGTIMLYCAFLGYHIPTMVWKGPQNSPLPAGRFTLHDYDMRVVLTGVTASDEGNYSCAASNTHGQNSQILRMRIVAEPEFRKKTDGPHNVSLTEGESVTFSCNPFAKPEAEIVWLQNEQPIDAENPPTKFLFSRDLKNLTIKNVNRESQKDLKIQCNASNIYGQAIASGYLNVLMKTEVTIRGPENASVDILDEVQFVFECIATSDPRATATVRWYKTEPFGDLVRDEPPYVNLTGELLIITIDRKCGSRCNKYFGEYTCVADNGYSLGNQSITLPQVDWPTPTSDEPSSKTGSQKEGTWAAWQIVLIVGVIGLGLLLVGIILRLRLKQKPGDVPRRTTEGNRQSRTSLYDNIDDNAVEESAENNKEGNLDLGYDSIDQVLDGITVNEEFKGYNGEVHAYDSIDEQQTKVIGVGKPMLDEDVTRDSKTYLF